jgi:hypothetical protein
MRLRIAASMLSLFCAWIMWEEGPTGVQAVHETKSLSDCRKGIQDFVHEKEIGLKKRFKEPDYTVIRSGQNSIYARHRREGTVEGYAYRCLTPELDPSRVRD